MSEEKEESANEPIFHTLYSPPSYEVMDPELEGYFKFVWEEDTPVGIVWTDLSRGTGIAYRDSDNPTVKRILDVISSHAEIGLSPSDSYKLLDTKAVMTDEQYGKLSTVVESSDKFFDNGEIPEEEEIDWDD